MIPVVIAVGKVIGQVCVAVIVVDEFWNKVMKGKTKVWRKPRKKKRGH